MSHTGSCLCGAVSFTAHTPITETSACHCAMCRKWSGGVFMGVVVPQDGMEITGAEHIATFKSSDWAERAFCKTCGSSLFYRVTEEGPMQGEYHIGLGTLDDANGIPFNTEFFIDLKPDSYHFGDSAARQQLSEEEVIALFSGQG